MGDIYGEFSTVELPDGVIETIFFGDDGSQTVVGRTIPATLSRIQAEHIANIEA